MNTELLMDCIKSAASAYSTLELAKSECEDVVDAKIDNLVSASEDKITKEDKKNIKKIAKAIASDKVDSLAFEAKSLAALIIEVIEVRDGLVAA